MKVGKHINYSDLHDAIVALTKVCYKTGDNVVRDWRDDLERYLEKDIGEEVSEEELEEEGSDDDEK